MAESLLLNRAFTAVWMRRFPHLVLNHLGARPRMRRATKLTPKIPRNLQRNLQNETCRLDVFRRERALRGVRNFRRQIEACLR